jgi:predicted 2-oxoglutarate/Fe(II)-dependent dioxygenase YbiX
MVETTPIKQTYIAMSRNHDMFIVNYVFACGDYTEGDVVLYELCCTIELRHGDMLLFPDSLIHHNNEKAQGTRMSIRAFTQENMMDYWV